MTTAFSYGLSTADAAVPRSGAAHFDVSLLGTYVHSGLGGCSVCDLTDTFHARLTGTGGIDVNFGTGALTLAGQAQEFDRATGAPGALEPFSGNATLAALANNFSGTFSYGSGTALNGDWLGRFYGPSAEEIGAIFSAKRDAGNGGGDVAIGAILGKRGAISTMGTAGYESFGTWSASPGAPFAARPAAMPIEPRVPRDVVPAGVRRSLRGGARQR